MVRRRRSDVPYCVHGCGRRAHSDGRLMGFSRDVPIVELVCWRHRSWRREIARALIVARFRVSRMVARFT